LQASIEARTGLIQELAAADARSCALSTQLREAEERLHVAQARQSATSEQAAAAQTAIQVLSEQLSKLDGKLDTLQQVAMVDRECTAEARQRAAVLEVRLEGAQEHKAELRSRVEAAESKAAMLQDAVHAARSEAQEV
jgi:chromosome segregation ATPase